MSNDDDDNNNNSNTQKMTEENNNYTGNGFLSTLIQPIFHYSNSNLPLSRFLTLPLVFSAMRTISLIDQSVKGYFQLAQTQKKHEQVLEFLPLEKVDEHYLPEEIEEEIIFPSNLTVPLTRKVTSSSFPLPSKQRSGKMPPLVSDTAAADVFRDVQSKVNIRDQQQPPPIDSLQRTSDNEIVHKKRSVVNNNNPPKEEKLRPSLSSDKSNQSPKFITEPEKYYSSEKPAGVFRTERTITTTPLPKNGDQSDVRKSSLSSSSKVQSSRTLSSEGPELFPRKYGEPTKQSSSTINASSRDITSGVKLNESKAATTTSTASDSTSSHKSKVIAEDDNSRKGNPQPEQFTNITKKILEPSAKTFSRIQPDTKIQIEDVAQTAKKIATPADKSLNLSDIFSQSAQDNSIRLPMSRNSTMNTSFASIIPSKIKIDDDNRSNNNDSIIKPHGLFSSQTSASDRNHKPTITINKLDVHVVGSSNYNVQRPILNRSTESADIHSHKLDFEDHQINTEILNKSYLWKYKVRL